MEALNKFSLRTVYKALAILQRNCEMYTRELLGSLGMWTYGEALIQTLCNDGLIARYRKCAKKRIPRTIHICGPGPHEWIWCEEAREEDEDGECDPKKIYNRLTRKGAEVLKDLEKYLELEGD